MREKIEFLKAALRNPLEVSTIFPTSRFLAGTLLDYAGVSASKSPHKSIVEVGAGTGAITKHLVPRLNGAKYLGIELDPKMVAFLRATYPGADFQAALAESLGQWAPSGSVDVVVSSLPWTVFPEDVQARTVAAIHESLREGGTFATYICANALVYPRAKDFLSLLTTTFAEVKRSPLELRNIPPAFVFRARK